MTRPTNPKPNPYGVHEGSLMEKLLKGELGPDAKKKYDEWVKRNKEDQRSMEQWWSEYNGADWTEHDE